MSLLIGLVDQEISLNHRVSWYDNKIGGSPVFMTTTKGHNIIPKCSSCATELTLVVQLYCPLAGSAYHRCLYMFACTSSGCLLYNSWRVFRSMLYDETYVKEKEKIPESTKEFDNDMWTNDQDDWGVDDADDWGDSPDDDDTTPQGSNYDDFGQNQISSCDFVSSTSVHSLPSYSGVEKEAVCDSDNNNVDAEQNVLCDTGTNSENMGKCARKEVEDDVPNTKTANNLDTRLVADMDTVECCGGASAATDKDLSSFLSMMVVNQEGGEIGSGDQINDKDINVESDLGVSNIQERFAQLTTVLKTKYQKPSTSSATHPSARQPLQLKPYYLSVVEYHQHQSHNALNDDGHIAGLIRDYEKIEGRDLKELVTDRPKSGKSSASETYEKSDIKHGDKVFHKFLKEIQKYPQQCIRYERGGYPLLVQTFNPESSTVPACSQCGKGRVFELQLVPGLIPWLHSPHGKSSDIEFGTILVYTCSQSCPPSNDDLDLVEEYAVVQHDPDHHLYR